MIHNYTIRTLGHDYIFETEENVIGWGYGLDEGDFILLENQGNTTRYEIKTIEYALDPSDMWFAKCKFSARTPEEKYRDYEQMKQNKISWV